MLCLISVSTKSYINQYDMCNAYFQALFFCQKQMTLQYKKIKFFLQAKHRIETYSL